jgi:UTP-glucose-1-phosphate uridylyltransferase
MLAWAMTFPVISLIAAAPDSGGIAGASAGIAQMLFAVFVVLFVIKKPGTAPSRLAAVGRYLPDPNILTTLERTPTGAGGEIQLTDTIGLDAERYALTAFRFTGTRYDCGSHDGLVEAAVARQSAVKRSLTALTAAQ